MATKTKVKAPDDSSHKYNTATGKLNPNYKAPSSGGSSNSNSASIKELQKLLNKKGANLKVDGIYGPLTKEAQSKYGYGGSTETKSKGSPLPGLGGAGYVKNSLPTGSAFSQAISRLPTTSGKSSGFNSILKKITSPFSRDNAKSQTSNALYGTLSPDADLSKYSEPSPKDPNRNFANVASGVKYVADAAKSVANSIPSFSSMTSSKSSADEGDTGLIDSYGNPVQMPEVVDDSVSLNDLLNSPGLDFTNGTGTGDESGSSLESPTPTVQNTLESPEMSTLGAETGTGSSIGNMSNPNANNLFIQNMGTYGKSVDGIKTDPYKSIGTQNDDIVNITDSTFKNAIASYNSPEEFMFNYNTNPAVRQATDSVIQTSGKTLNELAGMIKTPAITTNPQSTQQFLALQEQSKNGNLIDTKNLPSELKGVANNLNQQLMNNSQYISQLEKDLYSNAVKEYDNMQTLIEQYKIREQNREEAIEAKTDIMIKRYKAEMKATDAEIEKNRIQAKSNLTEFLAKIGALRTDGNAQVGIEKVEAEYQAMKQANRNKYEFAIDDLKAESDSKIMEMQSDLDDKILSINMDLSKSENEVRRDISKLRYDYNKDAIQIKMSYEDKLMDYNEKYKREQALSAKDWYDQYFTTSGLAQFMQESPEYQAEWRKYAQGWLTSKDKGSITSQNVRKSADEYDSGGGYNVDNNDPLGLGI